MTQKKTAISKDALEANIFHVSSFLKALIKVLMPQKRKNIHIAIPNFSFFIFKLQVFDIYPATYK